MRTGLTVVIAALALASGCRSDSDKAVATQAAKAKAEAENKIQAVEPQDMLQEASRKPAFRWRLPAQLRLPNIVTFKLFEVGVAEDPRKAADQEKPIALVTGLAGTNPTEVDLFKPVSPAVLTGDIQDMKQLSPNVWYHWSVRVVSDLGVATADFYFRTRADNAAPGTKP
jgi:hypothetical protein